MGNAFRSFRVSYTVPIGDINYGGLRGNDKYLALFHEPGGSESKRTVLCCPPPQLIGSLSEIKTHRIPHR